MRRFRVVGSAAVLALALVAVFGVSVASAEFTAEKYPAELEGTQSNGATWTLSSGTQIGSCGLQSFTASPLEKAEVNPELSTSLPDYTCNSNMQVGMNGCGFRYHSPEVYEANKFHGTFDIADAPGKSCSPEGSSDPGITLRDSPLWGSCHYTIPPQNNRGTVTVENIIGKPGTFTVQIESFFALNSSGGLCSASSVRYEASWTVKAYEQGQPHESKHQVGASVSEGAWGGAFVSSTGSYPVSYTGSGTPLALTMNTGQSVSCSASLSGGFESEMTKRTTLEYISASYSGCTAKIGEAVVPAEVTMHGCTYSLTLQTAYIGQAGMICPGSEQLEATVYANAERQAEHKSLCVFHVSSYSGVNGVGYTNWPKSVGVSYGLEGIPASRTGSILCGSPKTTKYAGEVALKGVAIKY